MSALLNGVRLVVFDFDGVILESAGIKTQAFLDLFDDHPQHRAAIREYHLAHQGISRYAKFAWIYANLLHQDLEEEESRRLGERFSTLVLEQVLAAPFVPGARELIRALQGRLPLAIASGTPEVELQHIVHERGLAAEFVTIAGTPRSKAEILRTVMAEQGVRPDQTLMIGDASTDHQAALITGTRFFARFTEAEATYWRGQSVAGAPDLRPLLAEAEQLA